MKTKILCLEGITGSGKTTQAAKLANLLGSMNDTYRVINEKQYEPFKQTIINWHIAGANQYFTQETVKSIAKARGETHKRHFIPLIGKISFLIFDRCFYTSGIYEADGELKTDEIIKINLEEKILIPQEGLVLLCSPETAIKRIDERRRKVANYQLPSIYETLEEITKRRSFYIQLCEKHPELHLVDTTTKSEEEVFEEVRKKLGL
ncbi:MAG: hypothetical protein AABW50_05535 [Nanoarchaeota archaeon]